MILDLVAFVVDAVVPDAGMSRWLDRRRRHRAARRHGEDGGAGDGHR